MRAKLLLGGLVLGLSGIAACEFDGSPTGVTVDRVYRSLPWCVTRRA
jgi:hypothetical protein